MKKNSKYIYFFKSKKILAFCSKKFLKLKRPKWNKYKQNLIYNLKRTNFINTSQTSLSIKKWEKKKNFYQKLLITKRNIKQLYYNTCKFKSLKKKLKCNKKFKHNNIKLLSNTLIKIEMRLDFLLYKLNFYSNIFEVRKDINKELILINNKKKEHNYLLKKGDVISFQNYLYNQNKKIEKELRTSFFSTFIEVDYYTGQIVIIKDFNELSLSDFSLIFFNHINSIMLFNIFFKR